MTIDLAAIRHLLDAMTSADHDYLWMSDALFDCMAEIKRLRAQVTITDEKVERAYTAFDTGINSVTERLRASLLAAGMEEEALQ